MTASPISLQSGKYHNMAEPEPSIALRVDEHPGELGEPGSTGTETMDSADSSVQTTVNKPPSGPTLNDSTLFKALQDPKIRMFLLLLEKQLLKWFDSNINS
jgi:hypothetical protein